MQRRILAALLGGLRNRVEADVPEGNGHEDGEHSGQAAAPDSAVPEIGGEVADLAAGDGAK